MGTVLAAVDNSVAAQPVLRAACVLGALLEAPPTAVHVRAGTTRTAEAQARACHAPLQIVDGEPVETLIAALADPDVQLGVFGARRDSAGARPAGHTTLAVATRTNTPLLVVPPDAHISEPGQRLRIVVPLDGTLATDRGAQQARRLLDAPTIDVTVLHAFGPAALPRFWDEPYHEEQVWAKEFAARHAVAARADVRLGCEPPADAVLHLAEGEAFDVIALVWNQKLAEERAQVVRQVLANACIPVLLLPVPAEDHTSPTPSPARPHVAR